MAFDENMLNLVSTVAAVTTTVFVLLIFLWSLRQRQFEILEQSFDVLQRINEKALETNPNTLSAVRSGNPNDDTSLEMARRIYFQYMRINRMFRAYEYNRGWFLTRRQRNRIVDSHIGTLKAMEKELPEILARGYPPDFRKWLLKRVAKAEVPPFFNKNSNATQTKL